MLNFLLRRTGWMVLTLWAVFTFSFFLMRIVPGGPFDGERQVPEELKRRIEARYQLDQPLYRQYLGQLALACRLDFGPSYKMVDFSVNEVIVAGFPVSASLGICALAFAAVTGLAAGVASALHRATWIDHTVMAAATTGVAVPNFVLASICIVLFVFIWPLFPAGGWGSFSQLILPALCLGAPYAAYIARLTRTGMLEVLSQDYIRTAYAKGLNTRQVVFHHALRGAMLPVASYLGPAVAGILTGSLVVERIFAIPGLGSHFIEAALQRDYTMAMGMILVYTFLLYLMNTLVDLAYTLLDPRIKLE